MQELLNAVRPSVQAHPDATPYHPRQVEMPLPIQGAAVAARRAPQHDPITEFSYALNLVTSCVQSPTEPQARDRDSCVASAPSCKTIHPWEEPAFCFPAICKELYGALRKKGIRDMEAWGAVRSSDCFPGVREFVKAAEERDAKAAAPRGRTQVDGAQAEEQAR